MVGIERSAITVWTPSTSATRSASAAGIRARSGNRKDSTDSPPPAPSFTGILWFAATTTGTAAYRWTGAAARMPVSIRIPQANTSATAKLSATNAPTKPCRRARIVCSASLSIRPPRSRR